MFAQWRPLKLIDRKSSYVPEWLGQPEPSSASKILNITEESDGLY